MDSERLTIYLFKLTGVYSIVLTVKAFFFSSNSASLLSRSTPFAWGLFILNLAPFILIAVLTYMLLARTNLVVHSTGPWRKVYNDHKNTNLIHVAISIAGLVIFMQGLFLLFPIPNTIQLYLGATGPVGGPVPEILNRALRAALTAGIKMGVGGILFFRPYLAVKLRIQPPSSDTGVDWAGEI